MHRWNRFRVPIGMATTRISDRKYDVFLEMALTVLEKRIPLCSSGTCNPAAARFDLVAKLYF